MRLLFEGGFYFSLYYIRCGLYSRAATNTSFMVNHYFAFDEKRVIDYDIKSFCFDNSILEEFHQIKLAKLKSVPAWHLTLDTID